MGCSCGVLSSVRHNAVDHDDGPQNPATIDVQRWEEAKNQVALSGRRLSAVLGSRFFPGKWKTNRVLHVKSTSNEFGWEGNWNVPETLFGEASDECCRAVASHLCPRRLDKGDTLFREGDEGTSMFFVNQGGVGVNLERQEVAVLGPGMYFGELGLMLNEGRMATTIASEDDSEVLELSRQDFYQVVEQYPEFANNIYRALSTTSKERIDAKAKSEGAGGGGIPHVDSCSVQSVLSVGARDSIGLGLPRAEDMSPTSSTSNKSTAAAHPAAAAATTTTARPLKDLRSMSFGMSLRLGASTGRLSAAAGGALRAAARGSAARMVEKRFSFEAPTKDEPPPKITPANARPGVVVSLDLEAYLAAPGPKCRFPGDDGPGQLLEDHFGDGTMWRVRWLLTNAWGIYSTGFEDQHHLFAGAEQAKVGWDSDAFLAPGRMPSFFFCAPIPSLPEDRAAMLNYASPRSRLLMQN